MSNQQARGFTLLEMLLVLAIFAALSISAFQILHATMRADELSRHKVQRLADMQRAFSQLERDFTQMIPRRSRGRDGLLQTAPHQQQSDDWGVAFTHNGWLNPLGMLPRSELQRVSYRLRQRQLERLSDADVNQFPDTPPEVKILLSSVDAFRLRFFTHGAWQESWNDTTRLPQGIEVTVVTDDFSELKRLFLINQGTAE